MTAIDWSAVAAARRNLAGLFEPLAPEQLDAPSLCTAWKVRDVAGHVLHQNALTLRSTLSGVAKARGKVDAWLDAEARAHGGQASASALAARLRDGADAKGKVPGLKPVSYLADVVIHQLDVATPLGVAPGLDPDHLRASLDYAVATKRPLGGAARCAGLRLVATDLDWSHGSGQEVRGPAGRLLLAVTGRSAGLEGLEGAGVSTLRARQPGA